MSALVWGQVGNRTYETGVDHGVLYPLSGNGVAWSGLTSISEKAGGAGVTSYYIDAVKYLDVAAFEDFEATLQAFSAPAEFAVCNGSKILAPGLFATNQPRQTFGLSYRTRIGNDLDGTDHGYKLHLVYNALAIPSDKAYSTINDSTDLTASSWDISTVPIDVVDSGIKPTAHFVIDSTGSLPAALASLEAMLYGSDDNDPYLPDANDLIDILGGRTITEPITEPLI